MFKHFSGRIIQVVNVLCYRDGVSNQIIQLHNLFLDLGLDSIISSLHSDPRCEVQPLPLDTLVANANDLIFFHYSGYAEALDKVLIQRCCKIFVYHNITPPEFFVDHPELFALCKNGLAQLSQIIGQFDYYLGVSQFNLSSLLELGAPANLSSVFPLIIDPKQNSQPELKKPKISWLFVGRLAKNKQQLALVDFFHKFIAQSAVDHELIFAGDATQDPEYYKNISQRIDQLGLKNKVKLLGSISDEDLAIQYAKAELYVSLSKHEGFGIPLIEACHFDLPVFALDHGAVGEVLQNSPGLAKDNNELFAKITTYLEDVSFKQQLLAHQEKLKDYYTSHSAKIRMQHILEKFIPKTNQYTTVSIVICTYNRANFLARCLDYLQNQTSPHFEVIVINGPSTDNTLEVIHQYKDSIKFAENPAKNLSTSRNLGIAMASGDIVAFIDDDAIPFDHWVETILKTYNSIPFRVAGVGGSTYYAGTLKFQACDDAADTFAYGTQNCNAATFFDPEKFRILLGTNATFKRHDLIAINGFDEQYNYFLDETDICFRLQIDKHKFIHFQSDLYLRHEFAQSSNRVSKHNYNWHSICKNIAYFIIKFNSSLSHIRQIEEIKAHLNKIYYSRINHAYSHDEINFTEMNQHIESIMKGMYDGIQDAKNPRKIAKFINPDQPFKKFNRVRNIHKLAQLHVVILTEEFGHFTSAGGTGTLYYQLASELLQMGHRLSVVIPVKNASFEYIQGNFALYKINLSSHLPETDNTIFMGNMNKAITATRFIQQLHEKQSIDIIDYSLWNTLGLTLRLSPTLEKITTVVRLVSPFKVVARINEWEFSDNEMELLLKSEKHLIENSSIVIPISHSIEKTMLEEYGLVKDQRWQYCPAGIAYWPAFDVNSDYDALNLENSQWMKTTPNTKKILFIGRLEARKGIDTFLNSIEIYIKKNPHSDCIFIIAGKDTGQFQEKFLASVAVKSEISDKVLFLGEIESSVKEKLYSFCDVLVFPSLYESFGLVPLEAFVHGKPVIAARAGAIPEVVQDQKNGLLFEPNNAVELADTIEQLINNPELYNSLSKGALHRIQELSSRNMTIGSVNIYANALKEKVS